MENLMLTYADAETGKVVKDKTLYNKKSAKKRRKELMKKKLAVLGSVVFYVAK